MANILEGCEQCGWNPCTKQGLDKELCFVRNLLTGNHVAEHWVKKRHTTQQQEAQHNG